MMSTDPTSQQTAEPVGAAPGEEVEPEDLAQTVENMRGAMTEMLGMLESQQQTIQAQADQLEKFTGQSAEEAEAAAAAEAELPVGAVPEGYARFYCPDVREYRIVRKRKQSVVTPDGQFHVVPQEDIAFQNNVYDTNDPDEIEFLRGQVADPRAHVRITEDPEARPHSGVVVVDGARGATSHGPSAPARPLAARL
jgi:hypothetical protein